jgi:hypothetical protein
MTFGTRAVGGFHGDRIVLSEVEIWGTEKVVP